MNILRFFEFTAVFLATIGMTHAGQKDGTLDIYWIDSEGGGSTLIVTPAGESVLIDVGHLGTRDAGWIVAGAKAAGVKQIDYLLLTHYHSDHFGGGAELAKQMPIKTIYERAVPEHDPDGKDRPAYAQEIKAWLEISAKCEPLAAGVSVPLQPVPGRGAPSLELLCVVADQKFIPARSGAGKNPLAEKGTAKNVVPSDDDNSAAFVLRFGDFKFFDGGDLTWNLEEKLVAPVNLVGPVDVYQVDHHGLDSSNSPMFVQSLAPIVTVMNNGPRKGGQPGSFAALRTVSSIQARYQVHRSLNVPAAENSADEFIANLAEARPADNCTANFIKLSVARDGKSYTISIPANGHSRTFKTTPK